MNQVQEAMHQMSQIIIQKITRENMNDKSSQNSTTKQTKVIKVTMQQEVTQKEKAKHG